MGKIGSKMTIDGLPVVDAKRAVILKITKTDIKKGANKSPSSCAAALACLRQIDGIKGARVHIGRTYIRFSDKWERFLTPMSLKAEIIAFDRGGSFAPGEYRIAPMPPSHRSTDRHLVKNKPGGKNRKRRSYHLTEGVRARGANK